MALVPMVVEQTNRGERSFDIYSRLLNDRIIMLNDQVDNASASVIIAQMPPFVSLAGAGGRKFARRGAPGRRCG